MIDFIPLDGNEGPINIVEYGDRVIFETNECSLVEIPKERLRDVITKLQSYLEWEMNRVAMMPMDGPTLNIEGFTESFISGVTRGKVALMLCPECAQGKVQNCAQQALLGDDLVPCKNARA